MSLFVKLSSAFCVGWNVPPVCIWMPKRQTAANRFLSFVAYACSFRWVALPLICSRFSPQFIWLSAFVCDPHYNPEIKYTSKRLKPNKIKCAQKIHIDWTYLYLSSYLSLHHQFPSLHLSECPQRVIQSCSVKVPPSNLCQRRADTILMCWVVSLKSASIRGQISLKPGSPARTGCSLVINTYQKSKDR